MQSVHALIASLTMCLPVATLPADDIGKWKTYPLASHGKLTANLRVRPEATLADEAWIAIEFVNQGRSRIVVKEARYTIDSSYMDSVRARTPGRECLAGGNTESLFPDAWETSPTGPCVIPPGAYRVVEQPSSYASSRLGLAPARGQRIKATIQLELVLDDGTTLTTNPQPTPFEFKWLRPDADGFKRMRGRLKHLVANPRFRDYHSYLVGTLLAIDDVSRQLTLPEVLVGLDKYGSMIAGRDRLARFLDLRFPNDPALVASLEDRLRRTDNTVLHDLMQMPNTWDDRLLEPLLATFEADGANWRLALNVLDLHDSPQKSSPAVAGRLSRAIVASGALSDTSVNSVVKISHALRMLGRTHDRTALEHVKPLLDDQRPAPVGSVSPRLLTQVPAFRVCDRALEAALLLLDGDASAMYPKFKNEEMDFRAILERANKQRDELIAHTKQRIGEN